MKQEDKYIISIVGMMIFVSLVTIVMILPPSSKRENTDLSRDAKIVRDYLDGKEIKGTKAWWINEPYTANISSLAKIVAIELKLDGGYVLRQLRADNFSLVYRPEPKKK